MDLTTANDYYETKAKKEENVLKSIEKFVEISSKQYFSPWGFRCSKQLVKLLLRHGLLGRALSTFNDLLRQMSHVKPAYAEKTIEGLLELVENNQNLTITKAFAETTIKTPLVTKSLSINFKAKIILATVYLKKHETGHFFRLVRELHHLCDSVDKDMEARRYTWLLQTLALECEMYAILKDTKKLKEAYQRAIRIRGSIPHPCTMGMIRLCGAQLHIMNRRWSEARSELMEAYKHFDDAGDTRTRRCIQYFLLVHILSDYREELHKVFSEKQPANIPKDAEIQTLIDLCDGFRHADLLAVEASLLKTHYFIVQDLFFKETMEELVDQIRRFVVAGLLRPNSEQNLHQLSQKIGTQPDIIERIIAEMITHDNIYGHIDQVRGVVYIQDQKTASPLTASFTPASILRWPVVYPSLDTWLKHCTDRTME